MIKMASTVRLTPPQEQQAWCWWHAQQQQRQQQQAETIRDGVLQEAFGFRRYLEAVPSTGSPPEAGWLERFNQFYQQLEALSDELLPPFIEDSLPLALQSWLNRAPDPIRLTVPSCDRDLPVAHNQTVLAVVAELLPILRSQAQPWQAQLTYLDEGQLLRFTCEAAATQVASQLLCIPEFKYLQAIFHRLTFGTLEIKPETNNLNCQLVWPIPVTPAPTA